MGLTTLTERRRLRGTTRAALAGLILLLGAWLGALPVAAAGPNLISNGGFESGITSWTVNSGDVDVVTGWQASEGTRSLDLNGFGPGSISQSFGTVNGRNYQLFFDLAGNPGHQGVVTLNVTVAGTTTPYSFNTAGRSETGMGWQAKVLNFTAVGSSTTVPLTGSRYRQQEPPARLRGRSMVRSP